LSPARESGGPGTTRGGPERHTGPPAADTFVLVTCEHATCAIPEAWSPHFGADEATLRSHLGWDPGALELAQGLASALGAPLFTATWSRLLVDANRSPEHPRFFSKYTRGWPAERRDALVRATYAPFREAVSGAIRTQLERGRQVLHLSCHSFTRVLGGKRRRTDVGLLHDPRLPVEAEYARHLRAGYRLAGRPRGVHLNLPYRGTSDGHTTRLRQSFGPRLYCGLELEFCQDLVAAASNDRAKLLGETVFALGHALDRISGE
jgi:predicted N-formylglutamate amidohydrolase